MKKPASTSSLPRPALAPLEARLGHVFQHPDWLEMAVTHRSYAAEAVPPAHLENQRLEFLGDAALGLISAEYLVRLRQDWQEGTLTKVRSRLTNAETLARVARTMELGQYLRLGHGAEQSQGRQHPSTLADALEAVVGALWLDGGPEPVRRLFQTEFTEVLQEALAAGADINPKGDLQEWTQRRWKEAPVYQVLHASGPSHCRHYRVGVFHRGRCWAEGEGESKQKAEAAAAATAWHRIKTGEISIALADDDSDAAQKSPPAEK